MPGREGNRIAGRELTGMTHEAMASMLYARGGSLRSEADDGGMFVTSDYASRATSSLTTDAGNYMPTTYDQRRR